MRIIAQGASGKAYGRKRGFPSKYLFPYDLVERGDEGKALKKGEATREEYVLGLNRIRQGIEGRRVRAVEPRPGHLRQGWKG